MYSYQYHKKSNKISRLAQEKYPWLFGYNLSNESIEARYWLLEYLSSTYNYSGQFTISGDTPYKIFLWKSSLTKIPHSELYEVWVIYWSLSHSENFIAFIVSDTHVGIDIIETHERDNSLFCTHSNREYEVLSGRNWRNFSLLWSAKESLIKKISLTLDDMQYIELKNTEQNILILSHKNILYNVHFYEENDIILTYTC